MTAFIFMMALVFFGLIFMVSLMGSNWRSMNKDSLFSDPTFNKIILVGLGCLIITSAWGLVDEAPITTVKQFDSAFVVAKGVFAFFASIATIYGLMFNSKVTREQINLSRKFEHRKLFDVTIDNLDILKGCNREALYKDLYDGVCLDYVGGDCLKAEANLLKSTMKEYAALKFSRCADEITLEKAIIKHYKISAKIIGSLCGFKSSLSKILMEDFFQANESSNETIDKLIKIFIEISSLPGVDEVIFGMSRVRFCDLKLEIGENKALDEGHDYLERLSQGRITNGVAATMSYGIFYFYSNRIDLDFNDVNRNQIVRFKCHPHTKLS